MAYATTVERHKTREVAVGDHIVGGENPIWVQSMTTTNTFDVAETLAQILRLEEAGCEIVRVTIPKKEDVEAAKLIRDRINIPLIADIHYDYRMALACLGAVTPSGRPAIDKIRINPGNIGGEERFKEIVRKARDNGIPMRIGVNSGSLEKDLIDKYGFPCPEAMVESALRYIEMAEGLGYKLMIISLKASHVPTALECYTQYAARCDYPTHVGITEAGSREYGTLKAPPALGAIVLRGIGDTIRVSLLGDPVPEIAAGFDILRACDRARDQARGRRLPNLRPARHRPGAHRRRSRRQDETPERPAQNQHPWLPGQWLRRGQGGRPGHCGRRRQGHHLQEGRPDPPCPGARHGASPSPMKSDVSTKRPSRWIRTSKKRSRRNKSRALPVLN